MKRKSILMALAALLAAVCVSWPSEAAETTFVVERPCLDIVKGLYAPFGEERPAGFAEYLPKLFVVNLHFQFQAWPKKHYYRFDTRLLEPAGRVIGLHKSLEIWAQGDRTIFRNRITITPNLDAAISQELAGKCLALHIARKALKRNGRLGQRIRKEVAAGVAAVEWSVLKIEDAAIRRAAASERIK